MHADGERIPMLTAYDYPTARIVDEAGMPLILVGDSLGMVMLGYEETVRVSMDEMLHHTKAVVRGTERALVVGDMPFLSYGVTPEEALDNAGRFIRRRAQAVKVEGGVRSARTIETIVSAGIPVMGHIGWTPQAMYGMGGKPRPGQDASSRRARLLADAFAVQEAGAFAVVLELVPEPSSPQQSPNDCASRRSASAPGRTARPGPGDHRPARPGHVHPAPRQALRDSRADHSAGRRGLRRRRGGGHVPG